MNINLTLIAQSVAFFIFTWLCWRFIWPVIVQAMDERRQRIEQGLLDADKAKLSLAEGEKVVQAKLTDAKSQADGIVNHANKLASDIEQAGRDKGKLEAERMIKEGQQQIELVAQNAKHELGAEVADLVYEGVEKIIGQSADRKLHDKLIKDLIQRLS